MDLHGQKLQKYQQLERELKEKSELNPALFHPVKASITTPEEKEMLKKFREEVINDKDRII